MSPSFQHSLFDEHDSSLLWCLLCASLLETSLSRTSYGSEHTVEPVAETSARRWIQAVHSHRSREEAHAASGLPFYCHLQRPLDAGHRTRRVGRPLMSTV